MFSKKDRRFFLASGALVLAGYVLMAIDPVENGFGILTLWIAPPLLLTGFSLPIFGIVGGASLPRSTVRMSSAKHVGGYCALIAALIIYWITLEPVASLWDCSEFIASAYKLQVPHTPGTPLSLLLARLFTSLSFGDVGRVAWTVNLMSGVFSALTVFLLYHIIFHLSGAISGERARMRAVASLGGALVLAFSDTFWFSAVEAETYGAASCFLLVLIWLILTGKDFAGESRTRRLVLIFYMAGLGYCIHPMCLLALPVLPFTWMASNDRLTIKFTLFTVALGLILVFLINQVVAVGMFEVAFSADRFLVNHLGFPFYSGAIALAGLLILLIRILHNFAKLKPYLLSLAFLILGFLPYLLLFIRSNHNPPIDETNPENLALIKAYMNRESYPSSPLLYGPYFDARIVDVRTKKTMYYKATDSYAVAGSLPEYIYDNRQTLLPRMYSNDPKHIQAYRSWTGLGADERPDFLDNITFMLRYQVGHMYLRYFLWNFAGRAGDEQDSDWLKPWQSMHSSQFEKARNQYWAIPLLLGLIGAVVQFARDRKGFVSVAIFFLIAGVVLALYLNSTPGEPRERDYIYVGSFIAFCIWIGLGLLVIGNGLSRIRASITIHTALCPALPLWMLIQNFDDHDRSGRTWQVDNARNTLASCAPGSILFTGGDNDTFPLWYLQEVEGFRTDVRVMVLSYMNTDWYINQLRKTYYNSEAFGLTLGEDDYRQYGPNDVLYVQETIKGEIDVTQYLTLLKNQHPGLRMVSANGEPYHILPSRDLRIESKVGDGTVLHVDKNYLSKNLLAILDLIISNEWKRPIYFNYGSMNSLDADISRYVVQEGPVFRLTPHLNDGDGIAMDLTLSYRNLVERADYSNLSDPSVYFSYEDHFSRMTVPARQSFNDLASAFLRAGDEETARKLMCYAINHLYAPHLPPSYTNIDAAEIMMALGEVELGTSLVKSLYAYSEERVRLKMKDNAPLSNLDRYLLDRSREMAGLAR